MCLFLFFTSNNFFNFFRQILTTFSCQKGITLLKLSNINFIFSIIFLIFQNFFMIFILKFFIFFKFLYYFFIEFYHKISLCLKFDITYIDNCWISGFRTLLRTLTLYKKIYRNFLQFSILI